MPMRERWTGEHDGLAENESDEVLESRKHHNKDKGKVSGRRDEKEHRSRDRVRSKALDGVKERERENKDSDKDALSGRDRRKEDRDERENYKAREKDNDREKHREKEKDTERKDRLKEKDREREKEKETDKGSERGKEKEKEKEKEKGKEKIRDKDKDKEKEKNRSKDREREKHRDRERERENDKHRVIEKQADQEKDRTRDRDRSTRKQKDESHDTGKDMERDGHSRLEKSDHENALNKQQEKAKVADGGYHQSASEMEKRISKFREERLKSSEGASDVLAWVGRSRKLEKEKALQLSKVFEEQDNMNDEESGDEAANEHITHDLGGVKVLHGIDKVLEGGAVVLTLKDQSILADGDINEEVDMLENVEIGEQKRRDEAYKAAKKKTGVYDDKFSAEPGAERKMLPQYDDPITDEGVTLDSSGRFTGEAERKVEELRKRILGVSGNTHGEDLNSVRRITSDYLMPEEMTKFKKTKKKKSLRKKEKLDIDALEAEAISAGLGSADLGSRNDGRRQNLKDEEERIDAEMRASAYKSAYTKAEEASKALRQEQAPGKQKEEDETPVFGDDDEDLRKSLARARKVALNKRDKEEKSGPDVVTLIANSTANDSIKDNPNLGTGDQPENKVVFTEMEEFVWGLQLDEEEKNPESEDVFMEEDLAPSSISDQEMKDEDGVWADVKGTIKGDTPAKEEEMDVIPDETIHEAAVGKGLAGALKLLKDRGTLKETVEWGGRNMDKKKSKLVGIHDNNAEKEINIDRTDEYGRILTPKEAFRQLSHKFHGKGPGKTKQEKRMRQYQEELKVKQMKNSDTPSLSVARMREAQATLQTPYLVLSGNVKPGQSSDPRSGFATVEKDFGGSLTPMLGDKKVEHFLNIKRKSELGDAAAFNKKPKA